MPRLMRHAWFAMILIASSALISLQSVLPAFLLEPLTLVDRGMEYYYAWFPAIKSRTMGCGDPFFFTPQFVAWCPEAKKKRLVWPASV
jgi:hypothetical protein